MYVNDSQIPGAAENALFDSSMTKQENILVDTMCMTTLLIQKVFLQLSTSRFYSLTSWKKKKSNQINLQDFQTRIHTALNGKMIWDWIIP